MKTAKYFASKKQPQRTQSSQRKPLFSVFSVVAFFAAAALLAIASPVAAQHRGGGGGGGAHGGGVAVGRAVPRGAAPQRVVGPNIVGPRVVGGRVVTVAPVRFYRPYYVFRPRVSLGFGLWSGYPVVYPPAYGYYNPYYYGGYYMGYYPSAYPPGPYSAYPYMAYPYPGLPYPSSAYPANGYPTYPTNGYPSITYPTAPPSTYVQPPAAQGSVSVQPGTNQANANMGGVSFEIEPATAEVFIDGNFVGTVAQFTPTTQPLGLTAGHHRLEIKATGYRTLDFDVEIVAGQVIPYQGAMER
jgi:PEGA domain-containing protein